MTAVSEGTEQALEVKNRSNLRTDAFEPLEENDDPRRSPSGSGNKPGWADAGSKLESDANFQRAPPSSIPLPSRLRAFDGVRTSGRTTPSSVQRALAATRRAPTSRRSDNGRSGRGEPVSSPLHGAELRRLVLLGVDQQHLGLDLVEVGLGIVVHDRFDRPQLVVGVAPLAAWATRFS